MTPPTCPYCRSPAELVDSAKVYQGKSYGLIWLCSGYPACDSYVGVHRGTTTPLGRMADGELRRVKIKAHAAFDPLWFARSVGEAWPDGMHRASWATRADAYRWLAGRLGIPVEDCHIGMFDVGMCKRVVEVCRAGVTV